MTKYAYACTELQLGAKWLDSEYINAEWERNAYNRKVIQNRVCNCKFLKRSLSGETRQLSFLLELPKKCKPRNLYFIRVQTTCTPQRREWAPSIAISSWDEVKTKAPSTFGLHRSNIGLSIFYWSQFRRVEKPDFTDINKAARIWSLSRRARRLSSDNDSIMCNFNLSIRSWVDNACYQNDYKNTSLSSQWLGCQRFEWTSTKRFVQELYETNPPLQTYYTQKAEPPLVI